MRVGEIQNKLRFTVNSENQIVLDAEAKYGGQAYIVKNYDSIIDVLTILADQKWNTIDFKPVEEVVEKVGRGQAIAELDSDEYSVLESYISSLNQVLPIYAAVINSMSQDQDRQVINVKLPETIKTLPELTKVNEKINQVFKLFKEDGEIEFEGFDKGTDWLIVLLSGQITFPLFLSCLDAARKYCEIRETWYKSEKARLEYRSLVAALDQKDTDDGFDKFCQKYIDNDLESNIKNSLENLELNGRSESERQNKIILATKELIDVMGDGVEFHLSLNPPEFAQETQGKLEINYKKLRQLHHQDDDIKQLPKGKKKSVSSDDK